MASIKRVGKDSLGVPVWEAAYSRTPGGKQVRRRFHAETKAEVQRLILLDSNKSDINLKWSEGLAIYVKAKRAEERNPEAIAHAERAVSVFTQLIGDIPIEKTDADTLKHFMQLVSAGASVRDIHNRQYTTKGPGVANHHRKELVTVARHLLRYAGKISVIPFLDAPSLPTKNRSRSPIHESKVQEYLAALQPHVLRPVQLVLYYGLRSTAICNLTPESVEDGALMAVDKGGVERRIPVDDLLSGIIAEASAFRETFPAPAKRLFVNKAGLAWNHTSLLRAAQRFWSKAGLEKKKIHEIRHTLGTVAGKFFTPGMVQAAMGHRSRKSAETYFHPSEEMAAEVREKIIRKLSGNFVKAPNSAVYEVIVCDESPAQTTCPCCGANLSIIKEKGRKP